MPDFNSTILSCCEKTSIEKGSCANRIEMRAKSGAMVPGLSFNNDYWIVAADIGLIEDEGLLF